MKPLPNTLCHEVEKNPALAAKIYAFIHQTTDRRKHYQNLWVDQVVSLTETDTVWPEFTDLKDLHAFADSLDIPVNDQLDYFLSDILENGLQNGSAVMNRLKTGKGELAQAGISPSFQALLKERLNRTRAQGNLCNWCAPRPNRFAWGPWFNFRKREI